MGYYLGMKQIHDWLKSERGRATKLAKHLGIGVPMVWKMANGERPVPVAHGAQIEAFTQGEVSRRDIWPDTWHTIWPELAEKETV